MTAIASPTTRNRLGLPAPVELGTRSLVPHSSAPAPGIDRVDVTLALDHRELSLTYRVVGDPSALRIPAAADRLDPARLWAHTCAEVFIAGDGERYVEWNLSPTGQAARFEFSAPRQRDAAAYPAHPGIFAEVAGGALVVRARVPVPAFADPRARLSPTMVLEHADGTRSYWALRHPAPAPDFHDPAGFALSLTCGPVAAIVDAP